MISKLSPENQAAASEQDTVKLPADETARLNALHSLDILDTPPEERFDRITRLVAEIFEIPVVTITLIDKDRQWFKSRFGLDILEMSRSVAFCSYAILEPEILVVPDATRDPRFSENPLVVSDPKIRFYAGAILKSANGFVLGTLSLIDTKPRDFDATQQQKLISFARIVESELSPNIEVSQSRSKSQLASNLDQTTGFFIFREFVGRCENYMQRRDRQQNTETFCCLLEMPNQDNLGHNFGQNTAEKILSKIAQQVHHALKDQFVLFGRLDRKSIAIFVPSYKQSDNQLGERIIEKLSTEIFLQENTHNLKIWCGISSFFENMTETLNQCRIALARIPKRNELAYRCFTKRDESYLNRVRIITRTLPDALRDNKLELHYQPQVSVLDHKIVGAEALLRWTLPELGIISPPEVIEAAQKANLTKLLDNWVLDTACRQLAAWSQTNIKPLPVSVNLMGESLEDPDLITRIKHLLETYRIDPALLHIEILETAVIEEFEQIIPQLEQISALGVDFSLDDFGTGYSSLRYLQRLPVKTIKIDRSFIREILVNREDAVLTSNIIALAHGLGMKVIAEGVESSEQRIMLQAYNCDTIQGYLFSKPVPAEQYTQLLVANKPFPNPIMSSKTTETL